MWAATGVFASTEDAAEAAEDLSILLGSERVMLFTPATSGQLLERVPVTEDMAPVGAPLIASIFGGVTAMFSAGFLLKMDNPLLAAFCGLLIAGAAALLGWVIGKRLDEWLFHGVPVDELFVYQDALQHGRNAVIVLPRNPAEAEQARQVLHDAGAESVDQARKQWWLGLREAEAAEYPGGPEMFTQEEARFRQGFEAAQLPEARQQRVAWPHDPVFRYGFQRGRLYRARLAEAPSEHELAGAAH